MIGVSEPVGVCLVFLGRGGTAAWCGGPVPIAAPEGRCGERLATARCWSGERGRCGERLATARCWSGESGLIDFRLTCTCYCDACHMGWGVEGSAN
jgi:hypothetical protein